MRSNVNMIVNVNVNVNVKNVNVKGGLGENLSGDSPGPLKITLKMIMMDGTMKV